MASKDNIILLLLDPVLDVAAENLLSVCTHGSQVMDERRQGAELVKGALATAERQIKEKY